MFEQTIRPGFHETDMLRHINNTVVPTWFEIGREPVFTLFNPDLAPETWCLIVARIEVDFKAPLVLGTDVIIRTFLDKVGNSSMTVGQEAWQADRLGATGRAVLVHYDYANERAVRIPDDLRAILMTHLRDESTR